MAIIEVVVPELSESVSEASLIEWKKKVGDRVSADEVLIEIETDKIVMEVPAPESGVLVSIQQGNGASVTGGQLLATIDTSAAASAEVSAPKQAAPQQPAPIQHASAPQPTAPAAAAVAAAAETAAPSVKVMPSAAKMMANLGLNPADVVGSGKGGRITKEDVRNTHPQPAAKSVQVQAPVLQSIVSAQPSSLREEKRVPMSRLRARVAERLIKSQSDAAILTTFNEVNLGPVMALRAKYKESFEKKYGIKLGFMSFFVKAAVYALQQYPIINASVEGSDIIYHNYIDIGVAVGSPRGLVVPVLRDADQLSFAQIERQIADFAKRAASGKLELSELTGGTFTISNGGVFGSLFSTPIINPPQSAILGIHATKQRPVVENGEIVIRPMNYFALSYDHRIIDGREAVLALVAMKDALEDPARLLLDI
ncbi:2-oxoglutarate dehydrogenase complex dihydrolipoyllysine-residue succinyltransferase [Turicimonas muris]|uniref:Dihydrolipoyllysine-residue succinyltransferase component of 2-oxoglutarate dehydrogenase complex n=8 Tax=Turicimonas muris TaxID=1796652 RepID=A0A227KS73_9BURK|nr:2-oxoglutarate dehydrogenase complex dihydrolipoyllysine-residue succinyltransferase [Turicimonas muris]ANU65506.1 dihydrolipoamide succinyltransferase [Burkholderiales bacterium YL45]OXE51318.1 dihydrolipoamide succinyltransferase [Turicimonas muris]QQQ96653.1 2-oxoglutarate dehydrogenase complex dihydrolipoyllysine-residue succinyltransferase [Turicimonas muris]